MGFEQRRALIEKIENIRESKVLCYVTSLRPGVNAMIADDAVREIIDHLQKLPQQPVEKLDLFLVSNGGDGVVPWRLVPIIREYAKCFSVLIPFKAFSAATIMALGANEIVMHKFAALGPIDPTVSNDFNPIEVGTNRKLGISVEDVKAYIAFIKDTVGINHEEELVRVIEILANKVHPLALGNVERFLSQSRMIASKLLKQHTDERDHHTLESIIEALTSKLYFHGHPINRVEASDLGLKILDNIPPELEAAIWDLYLDFEEEMKFRETLDPIGRLFLMKGTAVGVPNYFTELASFDEEIHAVTVESHKLSSRLKQTVRYTLTADPQLQTQMGVTQLSLQWSQARPAATPAGP